MFRQVGEKWPEQTFDKFPQNQFWKSFADAEICDTWTADLQGKHTQKYYLRINKDDMNNFFEATCDICDMKKNLLQVQNGLLFTG